MRSIVSIMVLLGAAVTASASEAPAPAPDVEVMIVGSYHFASPGLDVNNIKVDSVLTPTRQAEIDAVATALLAFKPTRVMVETQSDSADLAVAAYRSFTPDRLRTVSNESEQLGFRIAYRSGLPVVYGIDEQPAAGEPDYFPYDRLQKTAETLGQSGTLAKAGETIKPFLTAFEKAMASETVAQLLIRMNGMQNIRDHRAFYYGVLGIGDTNDQVGADLNAMWYLRNAKIFAKLMRVAKPGDRILVVYGAGHNYWLRHLASETPGFRFVDPVPYLKRAIRKK
jgi:Family of unknown function (DUF5694)